MHLKRFATGIIPRQLAIVLGKRLTNKIDRLANGVGTRMPTGSNTIKFITRTKAPRDRKITYGNMVCDIRSQKGEKQRVRLTVGGDQIDYPGNISTPTSNLTTTKLLTNSILSTKNTKGLYTDNKDFCLTKDK